MSLKYLIKNCLIYVLFGLSSLLIGNSLWAGELNRSDWVLTSSSNSSKLNNAIDSSASTRWDTGTKQSSGEFIQIDLGESNTINRVKLDTQGSANDYPRAYDVYTSLDGSNWGSAITSGTGTTATTNIIFKPRVARYVRIIQTGSDSRYYWSIHNLTISDNAVNCSGTYDLPACMTTMSNNGGGTIVLAAKTYKLTESLILKDNVNITGQSYGSVISWDDNIRGSIDAPLLYATNVNNVSLVNFKLRCFIDQSASSSDLRNDHMGIFLEGEGDPSVGEATSNNNLFMDSIEAMYCSNGMHIKGATGVTGIDLKLHNNGNTEVDLFHNIYLRRVADIVFKQRTDSSGGFYASPRGHGIRLSHIRNAYFENLSVYNNADHGVHLTDGIYDMRFNEVDIHNNCANYSGACADFKCYGDSASCDIDLNANKE